MTPRLPMLGSRFGALTLAWSGILLLLGGCLAPQPLPMRALNRRLEQAGSAREPSLAGRWLALIRNQGGRERVDLVDVEQGRPLPLPGLNRPDAQPLSVSVNASGQRLAVVRQREGQTELVLYRRTLSSVQPIAIRPAGVPRRVQLRADGRQLAVEVSRDGLWQIDLINLP
jgi:Tol biopolymer transport system component